MSRALIEREREREREREAMAASSSSSCKSRTSKGGEVRSVDHGRGSEEAELCACDTFCLALQQNIVNQPAHPCQDTAVIGECDVRNSISARKIHKADREKLRRDRLNEQLLELAGALDPDRPKNDKSTILGDTIQSLKDLMTEVQRLRAEHISLADESRDLSQEKKELKDEKLQLKSRVEHLQCQVHQQMHAMLLWMAADPSAMMNVGSFTYPSSSLPHGAADVDAQSRPALATGQVQLPFVGPSQRNGYGPMPIVSGSMAVHPALQAHYGYGALGMPYFPYPFNFSNGSSQAEVPSAQTPQAALPASGHSLQMRPMQSLSLNPAYPQVYGPDFLYIPPPIPENQYAFDAGITVGATMASSCHTEQNQVSSSPKPRTDEQHANNIRHVQTSLQLQTPASLSNPQPQGNVQAYGNQDRSEEQNFMIGREGPCVHDSSTMDCINLS